MMPYAQTEKGFVGVDNGPVRDNINIHLASVTAKCCSTPYHAMEMIRKVLAPFSIFPPQTNFLDGDSGHEVFPIKQFGDKMGMTNDGTVVVKNYDPYYVYFEYQMNDMGSFDIFCEIVEESELQEILDDIESEMEDGETTDGDEADAEDSFDSYKADNGMNEETLNELRGKSSLSKKEREELKRRIRDKHSKAWDKTQNIRKTKKSFGPSKDTKDIDSFRNRLSKIHNKLDESQLNEGRPSQRHPLDGHEYHRKSDAELTYIGKDAHKAAEAMKGHNEKAEGKYLDQANDAATVRHFRKRNGMPNWYKKKYGHDKLKEEKVDESNLALALGTIAGIAPAIYGMRSGLIQKGVRKASSMTSNVKNKIRNMIANKKTEKAKTEKK